MVRSFKIDSFFFFPFSLFSVCFKSVDRRIVGKIFGGK